MIYFGCLTEWLRLCTSVTAVVAGKTAKMQGEAAYTWWKGNIRFHELWKRTKLYFEYRCKLVFIQMRGYRKYKALGKLLQGPLNCSEAFKLSPGYKGPVPLRKIFKNLFKIFLPNSGVWTFTHLIFVTEIQPEMYTNSIWAGRFYASWILKCM